MSELEDSIERNPHPLGTEHSELVGASGDLPTPPFGHPSEEGIFRREIIDYEQYLKELARKLRQNMTLSEVLLWQRLKRKQMRGYDFDRQRPIDRYTALSSYIQYSNGRQINFYNEAIFG
jgi:Protein of unknown function (DUF559)